MMLDMKNATKKSPMQNLKAYLATLDLSDQRELLVRESYSSAFPGSAASEHAKEVRGMLEAFDLAHPEIVAAVCAAQEAAQASRLAGRDILGM